MHLSQAKLLILAALSRPGERPGSLRSIFHMFDKQEVQFLEKMFAKVVTKDMFEKAMKDVVTKDVLRGELDDVKREIRDEMHSVVNGAVAASERRMMKRMDDTKDELLQRMDDMYEEILDGVSEIIGDRILPQIDDHDVRITRLERRAA